MQRMTHGDTSGGRVGTACDSARQTDRLSLGTTGMPYRPRSAALQKTEAGSRERCFCTTPEYLCRVRIDQPFARMPVVP